MGLKKKSYLNARHSEIRDLKINCDWSLSLQLITLHTGQPKVGPHHILLTPLQTHNKNTVKVTILPLLDLVN